MTWPRFGLLSPFLVSPSISRDVKSLEGDMFGLKSDVSDLKTDMAAVKAELSGLKSDVAEIKAAVLK